jgi:hypothetical protein
MKTLVILIGIAAVIITVALWVSGIDYMNKNYPNYKGEGFLEDDENDEDK